MTVMEFAHPAGRRTRGRTRPGGAAEILRFRRPLPPSYDDEMRRLTRADPVLATALYANDPRNPPELRLAAHAEMARYFYGDPPRYDGEAFARLRATLQRIMGPKWFRYDFLMTTLAARSSEDRS